MLRNMTSIYIANKNKMLLLYRIGSRVVKEPCWCGIGGHFEEFEQNDPKACVLRELFEETGIKEENLQNIRLKYITLRNKNNEIRLNYYFFAEANGELKLGQCNEGILEWVEIDAVLDREMPFTAKECLQHYFSARNNKDTVYGGIATQQGVAFTELIEF